MTVTAIFEPGKKSARTFTVTQYDFGQTMEVHGLIGLPKQVEVHFAESYSQEADVTFGEVTDDILRVRIPDSLLETGNNISAYVYLTDETSGKTIFTVHIPVERRPKPNPYEEPEEQGLLRELLLMLKAKADDIDLVDGELQLLSCGKGIGSKVRLPSGEKGREIELTNDGEAIKWRYTDSNEWTELVTLESLRGPRGQPGETPEFEIRDNHLFAIYKD